MKLETFMRLLPGLKAEAKSEADLQTKIAATVNGDPIMDADGNEVDIATIDLGTAAPAEEPAPDVTEESVRSIVAATMKAELAKTPKPKAAIDGGDPNTSIEIKAPANVKRSGKLRNFKSVDEAYGFGQWALAVLGKSEKSAAWCKEHGVLMVKAQTEGLNTGGGYLVPEQFENTMIDLREEYGVFRRNAKVMPMTGDTLSVPRRVSGLTTYWVGENTAITESAKGWDRVNLTARKLGVLTKWSSELGEDAIISLADDLAGEIAYAFAVKEDACGFNGDGGGTTYGGIVGVCPKFLALSATRANIAGLIVGAGDLFADITMAELGQVVGRAPTYAMARAKWYCSKFFFGSVMARLQYAAGGNTVDMIGGAAKPAFMGYQVEMTESLPKVDAVDQIACLFGDLTQAAMFGDRRQTTIATSEHVNFAEDELAIRGTERFDINVHDIGNQSGTAASRVAGPIVGFLTAAS